MDFIQLQQLQQQAQEGNAHSAFYLGYLYETGARSDVPKDLDEAIYWYTVSGNRGSSDGHFNLARILSIKGEDLRALYRFEAAADLGHAKGAYNAAHMYRHGKPHFALPSNLTKALYYYRLFPLFLV